MCLCGCAQRRLCWHVLCFVQVPRVSLTEMGPQLDCVLRRSRLPPVDLEKEALKQPKLTKKKVWCACVVNVCACVWGQCVLDCVLCALLRRRVLCGVVEDSQRDSQRDSEECLRG